MFAHESPLEGLAPEVVPAAQQVAAVPGVPPSSTPTTHVGLGSVLIVGWLIGVAGLLVRALASQLRASRLADSGERIEIGDGGVDVRLCDRIDSPAITGVLYPVVMLPRCARSWSAERMRVVMAHELAHVRRRDTLVQLFADVACALHWFNPLAWMAASRLRVERELAADDAVLASGVRASRYAEELLAVAGAATAGALAMSERTTLQQRVVAILAVRRSRAPLAARGLALLVAGSAAVTAAAACASPEPPTTAPTQSSGSTESSDSSDSTDPVAQAAAEDVLATVSAEWSAKAAVVVVLDAGTGQILADVGRIGDRPFDVARRLAMPPGSALKPITIAAALETGAITATQLFETGAGTRGYGSAALRDAGANGTLDAAHVLAVSSNVGTSLIFDALGGERLATWLSRFHFADAPPLAGAITGAFPAMTTGTLDGATVAIGEGMTATPLQMAAAYAVLASDGVYHAPTTGSAATPGDRLLSPTTASQVMSMLETAVSDPTATGRLARVDGVHVAGKTGTAQFPDGDGHVDHTYASFIGIADLPARRVVALVGVETDRDGATGGKAAAPAFARLVARLR